MILPGETMTVGLLIIALCTLAFALVAKRLSSTIVTAPMLFIALGALLATTGLVQHEQAESALHLVAEIALIVLLFLDAAQINLQVLRKRHVWPVRMLVLGLPLAILLGTLAAWALLPTWPLVALALIAAILAPTDAALGQAVVTNAIVPARSRRALTVESGLNDGLALPIVLLFASLTAQVMKQDATNWLLFAAGQLILGPVVGVVAGLLGGRALLAVKQRGWTARAYEGAGALSLAGGTYLAATLVGGNGFIAAFVAGLSFGHVVQGQCPFVYEFTESEGQLLSWAAFLLLGLAVVPQAVSQMDGTMLAIILASLFVVRPLAVWLSLLGTDAAGITRLFFGWFGPRGLATALFALLVVEQIDRELGEWILMLAVNTVWISALLHGVSAAPGARWYAARIRAKGECAEIEHVEQSAKPLISRTSHAESADKVA